MSDDGHIAIAIIRDYTGLHAALRARAQSLNISRQTLDCLSGVPDGYSSKLLSPEPAKILGRQSFGPVLEALGVKLLMVEDSDAVERFRHRYKPRDNNSVRMLAMPSIIGAHWLLTAAKARLLAIGVNASRTPAQRSKIAKHAASVRWRSLKPKA